MFNCANSVLLSTFITFMKHLSKTGSSIDLHKTIDVESGKTDSKSVRCCKIGSNIQISLD